MNLIDRWRIARCIEDSRELPAGLSARVRASRPLSEYCSRLERVEVSLRQSDAPHEAAPAGLAESVLDRVRACSAEDRVVDNGRGRRLGLLVGFSGVGALAAAIVGVGLVFPEPTVTKPPSVLARGPWPEASGLAQVSVEGPLVREARLLAQDTRRAADVVLASFPSGRRSAK